MDAIKNTLIGCLLNAFLLMPLVANAGGYSLPDPTPHFGLEPAAVAPPQEEAPIDDNTSISEPHTVYFSAIDELPEYEDSETVAFPPDNKNRVAAADSNVIAASISLTCNPVEYGTPVTTTETVPVIAIIAAFDPPFAVKTNQTREDTQTTYAMGWLAPDPGFQNDLTIEGIDIDNDCVRDDIENYIYRNTPGVGNIAKRKYLFEYAKWLGAWLKSNSYSDADLKEIYKKTITASNCAGENVFLEDIFAEFHNTQPRIARLYDNSLNLDGWSPRNLSYGNCE